GQLPGLPPQFHCVPARPAARRWDPDGVRTQPPVSVRFSTRRPLLRPAPFLRPVSRRPPHDAAVAPEKSPRLIQGPEGARDAVRARPDLHLSRPDQLFLDDKIAEPSACGQTIPP